jgi:hypothetical protein
MRNLAHLPNWLTRAFGGRQAGKSRQGHISRKRGARLVLEALEDRLVPAVTVTDITNNTTFATIQSAVDAVTTSVGDTLRVSAGVDNESVTVDKSVILEGAQFGVDARTRSGAETVMDASGNAGKTPFHVTASDVTIDGFTVENQTDNSVLGFGILLAPTVSGTHIVNDIIRDNIAGLGLANTPVGNPALIQHNLFENNNQPGSVSGAAIYTDQGLGSAGVANVTIDANSFVNNQNAGVLLGSTVSAQGDSHVTISNNTFDANGSAVVLLNTTASSVTGNTITGSTGSQIAIGGGVNGLQITQNYIQNGATNGIRIGDFGGGSANTNVTINDNFIAGNATAGLAIDSAAGSYTGTLDATQNYWGSSTGPTTPNNPGGTGDKIVDPNNQVTFRPYLTTGTDTQPNTPGFQPTQAFTYDAATKTLTISATNFGFSQTTVASGSGTSTTYTFTVDGVAEQFSSAMVTHVIVNGASSNNTAILVTSDTYLGTDNQTHETAELALLGPGGGLLDQVDASGHVTAFLQLNNFATSYAYMGRADSGQLRGTTGASNFLVTAGSYSYMSGAGQFHLISGAPNVYGYSTGANDQAYHYDGSGASTYVVSGTTYSYMSGTDHGQTFFNEGVGFRINAGQAQHAGDTAYFMDSLRNDVFDGAANSSYMYSANSDGSLSEYDVANAFSIVHAQSTEGGTDYAYNHDPAHIFLSGAWIVLT